MDNINPKKEIRISILKKEILKIIHYNYRYQFDYDDVLNKYLELKSFDRLLKCIDYAIGNEIKDLTSFHWKE